MLFSVSETARGTPAAGPSCRVELKVVSSRGLMSQLLAAETVEKADAARRTAKTNDMLLESGRGRKGSESMRGGWGETK